MERTTAACPDYGGIHYIWPNIPPVGMVMCTWDVELNEATFLDRSVAVYRLKG